MAKQDQKHEMVVAATKIGKKHQITIPKEVYSRLNLFVGDFIEFRVTDGHVRVLPKKLVSRDDTFFYTKEWQKKEQEADRDIAVGNLTGPFSSTISLQKHLQKLKKKKK